MYFVCYTEQQQKRTFPPMEVDSGEDFRAGSSVKTLANHKQFPLKSFLFGGGERFVESLPSVCFCTDSNRAPLPGNSSPWAPLKENFLVQRLCRNPMHLNYPIQRDLWASKEFVAEIPRSAIIARLCVMLSSIPVGSLAQMGRQRVLLFFASLPPAISLRFFELHLPFRLNSSMHKKDVCFLPFFFFPSKLII